MKLSEAVTLVLEDERQSYSPSEMTDAECLVHVYDTVSAVVDGEPKLTHAYHAFLNAMDELVVSSHGPRLPVILAAKELLA